MNKEYHILLVFFAKNFCFGEVSKALVFPNMPLGVTFDTPHKWLSDSELKTGRREVPGSIPGRACQPSRSEFTVVFSVLTYIRAKIP